MPHDFNRISGIVGLLACLPLLPAAAEETGIADKLPPAVTRDIDFDQDIRPLFEARCLKCHGADRSTRRHLRSIRSKSPRLTVSRGSSRS